MTREQRLGERVPLELPVHLEWQTARGLQRLDGTTRNISGNGIFVTIRRRIRNRAPISFRLDLPPEVTGAPVQLLGHGRVVRNTGSVEAPGIAAIIDEYEIRPVEKRVNATG